MKKKQITITLTVSENNKNVEGKYSCKSEVIRAWTPIIIGCLEYLVNTLTESFVLNRDKVTRILPSGIQYVNQFGFYGTYCPSEIKSIEAIIEGLKAEPSSQPVDFTSKDLKEILRSLKYINRAIGPRTDEEVIKNFSFARLHNILLDKYQEATIKELRCLTEIEKEAKPCKRV